YLYSYILLPWIFLLFYKNFHIDNLLWKRIVFALVFLLLLSGNPANTIGIVVLLLFYDLFFKSEDRIIKNWKKFSITLFLILIFSSYIILPTIGNSGNPYGQVASNDASITFNSSNTSISNLFRLKGHPAEDSYIFSQFINSRKIILANFIILFLAFAVLIKKRISKLELFLLATFLLALFLAKAEHPPLSIINAAIYSKVPLFEMFRASYYKFVIYCAFSLSLLLPLGILAIFQRISMINFSRGTKLAFLMLPILLIILSAKPFFSGDVANKAHKVTIPVEYDQINKYFSGINEDFSVLSLPQLPSGVSMNWGDGNTYGSGSSPDTFLLGRPTWTNNNFLTKNNQLNNFQQIKSNIAKTNTRYVLLHKDMTTSFLADVDGKGSYKNLEASILADSDFNLIENNKYFSVFEIRKGDFISHISISPDGSKASNFEIKKNNLTKYSVVVRNVSGILPVVFAESFNKGWKVYLLDASDTKSLPSDTWFKKPIAETNHILANEYQNGWNIDVDGMCRDNSTCQKNSDGTYNFKLVIEFWPQRLFYLGLLTAIGGLMVAAFFAVIQVLKKKNR
ncbi:MAG: hypothetical protein NTY30_04665, partial [Candidatus Berkelbacteria bacterium]|nr:hypothetical protein [Candidatus Berkelbacteria bacterium]